MDVPTNEAPVWNTLWRNGREKNTAAAIVAVITAVTPKDRKTFQ
jgi:hypothetical protein